MKTINLADIPGMTFPTGRYTRVMIGADSPIQAENFTMGYVKVNPQGSVPKHVHEQEEVYFIAEGNGRIEVGNEVKEVSAGTSIYIPSNVPHELVNTGNETMTMIFVYSPAGTVDHWDEERK
ncbi:cupin domain-containing protein [Salicibibacter cibarius]|uniref:Cupin domain-containing protein n=1 Tax=Salicibibacter cibarius TaxID=2743000 RepID=A0A7T6Z1S7_9BACI|nr:dimethylsulfonioproprionate lyase family protein [Salicibibacter cibarius]QQK75376.1 cupin domain-containing protein [Salicibibacter cibarius]